MEKACSRGLTVKCMTESGLLAKSMDLEYGKDFWEIHMLVNGEKEMLLANEAYSSPILPTYIYYPMLWAKGIVYIGKNVRESSNKQPPYVLLLLLVQFACISFIPSLCSPAENECNCVLNPFVGNEGHLGTPSCWPPKLRNFQSYQFFPHSSNK